MEQQVCRALQTVFDSMVLPRDTGKPVLLCTLCGDEVAQVDIAKYEQLLALLIKIQPTKALNVGTQHIHLSAHLFTEVSNLPGKTDTRYTRPGPGVCPGLGHIPAPW